MQKSRLKKPVQELTYLYLILDIFLTFVQTNIVLTFHRFQFVTLGSDVANLKKNSTFKKVGNVS